MFEEAVQIVRGLLTTDGFTFEGEHFQVRDATLLPRPVQHRIRRSGSARRASAA